MIINRRSLLTGLISIVAAPAIVRASSLMPVRTMLAPDLIIIYACTSAGVICNAADIEFQSSWRAFARLDGLLPASELPPRWSPNTAYNLGDIVRG